MEMEELNVNFDAVSAVARHNHHLLMNEVEDMTAEYKTSQISLQCKFFQVKLTTVSTSLII